MKKILYIHQYFTFPDCNGGTRSYNLARSFIDNGFEVIVVTSSSSICNVNFKKGWNYIKKDGLKLFVLDLNYNNSMTYIKRILVFLKFLIYSSIKIIQIKADIVIATSTPLTIGIPAILKKMYDNTPFIFEVRDVWPEAVIAIGAIKNKVLSKLLYFLEKTIYNYASYIVPLSIDMKKSIITRYPKLETKIPYIIENISEIDRFENNTNKISIEELIGFKPRFTILYAGTFGKVNRIEYVVQIAKKILTVDSTIVFLLIGEGIDKNNIIKLAKDNGVYNKNIFIKDSVRKEMLPAYYSSVDMGSSFVSQIKELWANSANKFFDTLAAGIPILINYGGWQKEVIENNNIGYVLPDDINDFNVNDFISYTKNDILINTQRSNAKDMAKNFYSLSIASQKYINIVNKI